MKIKFYNSIENKIIPISEALKEGYIHLMCDEIICYNKTDKVLLGLGIKDCNGVEIFEGDIVFQADTRIWHIEYGYFGDASFYVSNSINSGRLIECDAENWFTCDGTKKNVLKVQGNINIK